MKSVRLLPVVVMAVAAVLLLKTIGLLTNGGYVLSGVTMAQAAGDTGGHEAPAGESEAGDTAITFPPEPTISDTSPVLTDVAPTLGEAKAEGDHGAVAEAHSAPAEAGRGAADALEALEASDGAEAIPDLEAGLDQACSDVSAVEGGAPAVEGELTLTPINPDCPPQDSVPMSRDANGNLVPMADGGSDTTEVLAERLTARRGELEGYEQELAMRASLLDAAEKRLEERSAALEALQAQVTALIDQRTAIENEEFASVVAMYETMKPKDAAAIFNDLEMDVLLRVAKKMSARKMAPIMAEMSAARAQELTVAMSTAVTDPIDDAMKPEDLAALPQIVGQ